jgi:hypothetical protein
MKSENLNKAGSSKAVEERIDHSIKARPLSRQRFGFNSPDSGIPDPAGVCKQLPAPQNETIGTRTRSNKRRGTPRQEPPRDEEHHEIEAMLTPVLALARCSNCKENYCHLK